MQYLLTEAEFQKLTPKQEPKNFEPVRALILKLANLKCIHDPGVENRLTYCDECPIQDVPNFVDVICKREKDYSK